MPKLFMAFLASLAAISMQAQPDQARLLVTIMVDGLDADYVDLLREQLGQGGFRMLEKRGVRMDVDYGTSLDATAATAMLVSGAAPSTNGISADSRFDRITLRPATTYTDPEVLGNFTTTGFSPATLRVSTLSDEIRVASGGTNAAYAIAPTPGMAIALAGHAANSAMWLDTKTGNWASSTYYQEMPVAVAAKNRTMPLSARLDTLSWKPSLEPSLYPALPDHLKHYPFRHLFPRGNNARFDMYAASPMLNNEITGIASDLLRNYKLGMHEGVTDVLNIGYSLNPYPYGKNDDARLELMDAYVKLDGSLEQLFSDISKTAGLENTIILLSGTPPRPQRRRDDDKWNIPHGEFSTRRAISLLNVYLMALYGNGDYVSAYHNGHIYLNQNLLKEMKLDVATVRSAAATFMARMTGVDRVFTIDEIIAGTAGQNAEAIRRNTVAATAGDLLIEPAPGFEVVDDYNIVNPEAAHTGMVHAGVTTTAPVYIFAPDVAPKTLEGVVDARVVAPTVARILRIRSPNGAVMAPLKLKL